MAHFSIWVPGGKGDAAEVLGAVGMADLISPGDISPSVMPLPIAGPCGGVGLLVQWIDPSLAPERQCRLGYHKDAQTWSPLPAFKLGGVLKPRGTAWIGFETDRPLQPEDVLRRSQRAGQVRYAGRPLTLGDNQRWIFPNLFSLPMEFAIDPETGEDKKVVLTSAMPVWTKLQEALAAATNAFLRDMQETWEQIPEADRKAEDAPAAPGEATWSDYDVQNFNCWALGLNYRMTKLIAVTQHLFNNDNLWHVLFQTTDSEAIWKLQTALKKTETLLEASQRKTSESLVIVGGEAA